MRESSIFAQVLAKYLITQEKTDCGTVLERPKDNRGKLFQSCVSDTLAGPIDFIDLMHFNVEKYLYSYSWVVTLITHDKSDHSSHHNLHTGNHNIVVKPPRHNIKLRKNDQLQ